MDKKVSELESSDEGQVTSSGQALKDIDDQISHDLAEEISVAANVATNNDLQIEVDTSLEKDPASVEIEVIEKSPAIQEVVPEIDYQAEIDKLLVPRQSLADEAVLLSEQIKKQEDSTDALHRWVSEQKGSFLWKVLNRMSNNKS